MLSPLQMVNASPPLGIYARNKRRADGCGNHRGSVARRDRSNVLRNALGDYSGAGTLFRIGGETRRLRRLAFRRMN